MFRLYRLHSVLRLGLLGGSCCAGAIGLGCSLPQQASPNSGPKTEPAPPQGGKSSKPSNDSPKPSDSPDPSPSQGPSSEDDPGQESPNLEPSSKFDLGAFPSVESGQASESCDIDFLFVIDNSRSMADEQLNLANAVPNFIKTMKDEIKELERYHIGVVVADGNMNNDPACQELGALITRTWGPDSSDRACGPYAEGFNFMTNADALDDAFACAAKTGTSGSSNERPMDALLRALEPDMLADGACNADFLRDDALLVVTIITDEEDDQSGSGTNTQGSAGDPASWKKRLLELKGNDPKNLVVMGLIATPTSSCDPLLKPTEPVQQEGGQISERLETFVKSFGDRGFVGDVCADNYGEFFRDAVRVVNFACQERPPG